MSNKPKERPICPNCKGPVMQFLGTTTIRGVTTRDYRCDSCGWRWEKLDESAEVSEVAEHGLS